MLAIGTMVADRFRLLELLGTGATAYVFRASDLERGGEVALKVLRRHAPKESEIGKRFLREARVASAIAHPYVVRFIDFGIHHEEPYLAMELIEGELLSSRIAREPRMSTLESLRVARWLLMGLGAVHLADMVHRDVKPENIMLLPEGLKLLDFGLSRPKGQTEVTVEGTLLGTPDYMPPEQALGRSDVDRRADLYSVGVIVYECLSRRRPYEGRGVGELLIKVATEEPTPLRERMHGLADSVLDLVDRATRRSVSDRFQSAAEFISAIDAIERQGVIDPWAATVPLMVSGPLLQGSSSQGSAAHGSFPGVANDSEPGAMTSRSDVRWWRRIPVTVRLEGWMNAAVLPKWQRIARLVSVALVPMAVLYTLGYWAYRGLTNAGETSVPFAKTTKSQPLMPQLADPARAIEGADSLPGANDSVIEADPADEVLDLTGDLPPEAVPPNAATQDVEAGGRPQVRRNVTKQRRVRRTRRRVSGRRSRSRSRHR